MGESIKQYKTIESSSKSEFNISVNFHLDLGWKILDNSFNVNVIHENDNIINVQINKDDLDNPKIFTEKEHGFTETTYSQVLIWEENNNDKITFHDNGCLESRTVFKNKKLLTEYSWNEEGNLIKHIKYGPSSDTKHEKYYTNEGILWVDYKKINGKDIFEKRYYDDGSISSIREFNKEGKLKFSQDYNKTPESITHLNNLTYLREERKINKSTDTEKYFDPEGNLENLITTDLIKGLKIFKSFNSDGSVSKEQTEQILEELAYPYKVDEAKVRIPLIERKIFNEDGSLSTHEYRDKEHLITKSFYDKFKKHGKIVKKIKLSNKFHEEWFSYNDNGEIQRKWLYDCDRMIYTETKYKKNKISNVERHTFQIHGGGIFTESHYHDKRFHISNIHYDKNGNEIEKKSYRNSGKFTCKENWSNAGDGHIILEGEFKDGLENGIFTYFNEDGSVRKKEIYKDGKLIETKD
tara:strand:+ start:1615 stop:3012 length:1398 start_codon:yes stop_codon:yes gene_type:complete